MRVPGAALLGTLLIANSAFAQSPEERRLQDLDRACVKAREAKIREVQRQKVEACVKEPPEYRAAPKSREDCERYWKDYGWAQGTKGKGARQHLYSDAPACRRAAEARRKYDSRH
jgi:hypothetical protein